MSTVQEATKALFRKAVERASWAPSVHNASRGILLFGRTFSSCTGTAIDS